MRILHLLSTTKFSGAENLVVQLIDQNKTNNPEIEMVYCSAEGEINKKLKEMNINHLTLKKNNYFYLYKAIKKFSPDILHAHDVKASILISMFSNKFKKISHVHGNHTKMKENSVKSILFLLSSYQFNKIIWVSKSSLTSFKFKDVIQNKSIVLNNVINRKLVNKKVSEDLKSYDLDVVFVGRLSPEKDPKRLIDILELVKKEMPSIKLGIVGDGMLKEALINYIDKKNISENVVLLGQLSNPYKIIKDAKLMLMTSIYEGTPMAALESMELGTPIISTPTDGLVEIIDNNINGFYSASNKELAEKIIELLTDETELMKMSDETKKKSIILNDISSYHNKIIDIYRRKS